MERDAVEIHTYLSHQLVPNEVRFILYIPRFSHQILLCEKALRILLRPIREAKRVSHT